MTDIEIFENMSKGKFIVRKTVDESGDYPLTIYSIVQHFSWGDRILVEEIENPYDAFLFAKASSLLKEVLDLRKKVIKKL